MIMRDVESSLVGGFPTDDDARRVLNERIANMTYLMLTHCQQLISDITDDGNRTNTDAQEYLDQKILGQIEAMDETRAVNWPEGNAYPDTAGSSSPSAAISLAVALARVPSGPARGQSLFKFTYRGIGEMPDVQIRRSSDGTLTPKYALGSDELKALPVYIALSEDRKKYLHGPYEPHGYDESIKGTIEGWNKKYPEGTRRGALQRIKYMDIDIAWIESLSLSNILGPAGSAGYMFSERDDGLSLTNLDGITF